MLARSVRTGAIDRMGIALSGLCVVHCVASAVWVAVLASAGGVLLDPMVHEVGLVLALVLGIVGLGRGVVEHGFMMPAAIGSLGLGVMTGGLSLGHDGGGTLYAIVGVLLVALGHDLNRRAVI
ncbi:MAG TPA: MerC domain-containing protein [Allosphingosinicella sp.]|nr:MerC domain-containing protein [Allosphingosinicella sp.]